MSRIKAKYMAVLQGYLGWIEGSIFLRPEPFPFLVSVSAEEAMRDWESRGITPQGCSNPELLQSYMQGKVLRDWHIAEWRKGVRDGLFISDEFLGSLGCNADNFESIFGHPPRSANSHLWQSGELKHLFEEQVAE